MRAEKLTNDEYEKIISMEFDALSWLAILGNVALALRHPQNVGASRSLVVFVRKRIENNLMCHDIIDQEDIESMRRGEDQTQWMENGSN